MIGSPLPTVFSPSFTAELLMASGTSPGARKAWKPRSPGVTNASLKSANPPAKPHPQEKILTIPLLQLIRSLRILKRLHCPREMHFPILTQYLPSRSREIHTGIVSRSIGRALCIPQYEIDAQTFRLIEKRFHVGGLRDIFSVLEVGV